MKTKLDIERSQNNMKALIIKQPWIGMILDGKKTWELRSSDTKVRGRIALIEAGSGLIVGEATLDRTMLAPTKLRGRFCTRYYHRIPEDQFHLMDKWKWVWVLEKVKKFEKPLPYDHPQGAVIWVKLNP